MSAEIFCPICKFKNVLDATQCKYCGAPLVELGRKTTTNIAGDRITLLGRDIDPKITSFVVPSNALAFFIMKEDEPVVISDPKEVYLGRLTESPSNQLIDLGPFGAFRLGVSRFHARIIKEGTIFIIEDLYSSNGTWVNDRRITPKTRTQLNHLDYIQLGRLNMVVSFPPDRSSITKPLGKKSES